MARFIKNKTDQNLTSKPMQCIVISLKEEFYGHADSLVGVTSDVIMIMIRLNLILIMILFTFSLVNVQSAEFIHVI